jgi:hypothetical protein
VVRGDQIVAQSNYVSRGQQAADPASLRSSVRADFVLFSVRYETGTRALEDEREDRTRENLHDRWFSAPAAPNGDLVIEVGTSPAFSAAIETAAMKGADP